MRQASALLVVRACLLDFPAVVLGLAGSNADQFVNYMFNAAMSTPTEAVLVLVPVRGMLPRVFEHRFNYTGGACLGLPAAPGRPRWALQILVPGF